MGPLQSNYNVTKRNNQSQGYHNIVKQHFASHAPLTHVHTDSQSAKSNSCFHIVLRAAPEEVELDYLDYCHNLNH